MQGSSGSTQESQTGCGWQMGGCASAAFFIVGGLGGIAFAVAAAIGSDDPSRSAGALGWGLLAGLATSLLWVLGQSLSKKVLDLSQRPIGSAAISLCGTLGYILAVSTDGDQQIGFLSFAGAFTLLFGPASVVLAKRHQRLKAVEEDANSQHPS